MIFELKDFYVDLVDNKDLDEVAKVYNSNRHFLLSHMDKEKVTIEWILQELKSMKEVGFNSCKIVEISSGNMLGVIDFKTGEETYLSLLMVHNDFKGKGIGKLIFESFEKYAKLQKSKSIRIDVVTHYDNSVLDFWIKSGFLKIKDVELNWTGKTLPAITMKKNL
ncbi:MAG: GCN5-related N-acetyltransferase [Lachnospiraceae bacterium]|jgi:GNAT superfamily N-acetyltransferase|nr:GCN5-related N-acetyltransferase [Lachnospiraceae bacterium]